MGQAVPDKLSGDLKGGGNHVYIAGPKPGADGIYLLYEWPAGGTGGSAGRDGNNAVRNYTEGDFNSLHAVEVVESAFPLLVERCEIREGSGGDGAYRGGFGLIRQVRVLDPTATLSVLSEKNVIPPYGVNGGMAGAANRFTVLRDGALIEPSPVPGKVSGFALREGDIVQSESAGGGGYGDPLTRSPEQVLADVRQGYINAGQAEGRYGGSARAGFGSPWKRPTGTTSTGRGGCSSCRRRWRPSSGSRPATWSSFAATAARQSAAGAGWRRPARWAP